MGKSVNKIAGILATGAAVAALVAVIDGGTFCLFKNLTGAPCPGCGLGRAWLAMAALRPAAALAWHPLFWLVVPVAVVLVFRRYEFFAAWYRSSLLWLAIIASFLLTWVMRLWLFFPGQPPFDVLATAPLWRCARALNAW